MFALVYFHLLNFHPLQIDNIFHVTRKILSNYILYMCNSMSTVLKKLQHRCSVGWASCSQQPVQCRPCKGVQFANLYPSHTLEGSTQTHLLPAIISKFTDTFRPVNKSDTTDLAQNSISAQSCCCSFTVRTTTINYTDIAAVATPINISRVVVYFFILELHGDELFICVSETSFSLPLFHLLLLVKEIRGAHVSGRYRSRWFCIPQALLHVPGCTCFAPVACTHQNCRNLLVTFVCRYFAYVCACALFQE